MGWNAESQKYIDTHWRIKGKLAEFMASFASEVERLTRQEFSKQVTEIWDEAKADGRSEFQQLVILGIMLSSQQPLSAAEIERGKQLAAKLGLNRVASSQGGEQG